MAVLKRRKKFSEKKFNIIFCACLFALLAMFIGGLFTFSANYGKIYDSPQVSNGQADFYGVDLPSRDVACNLAGEWEFFYNKWIVTDGDDGEPDGMIKMPDVWTFKNFGNGALPKTGYGSYRLIAENVQADTNVIVYRHYGNFAYRVFINGQLNYLSGTLSKDAAETKITGKTDERHPYRTDGSPLEIVIEVSANNAGGFNAAPWIAATATGNSYGTSLRSYNYIAVGIAAAAVSASILTFIFFRYKRDFTVPAFMTALFVHFMSSKDMLYVTAMPLTASMILQLISAIAAFILLILHLRHCGTKFGKKPVIITSAAGAVMTILLFALYGTPLAAVPAFLLIAIGCAYLIPLIFGKLATFQRTVYSVLFAFLMSVFSFELCDWLGLLVFGTEFIFSFELMLIIACFTVLWLWKMAAAAHTAMRVGELESELFNVKQQALKAQIKPHFIFNSLTAIQARYRKNLDEGDKAITQFAKHLRLITDSDGEELVPFENEVKNVLNYFELENLRADGKLTLLLDINYTEFSVPVLSLQPLVENAVRHSGIQNLKDGYIQLCSERAGREIKITVSDNGAGFDPDTVSGVGLENTRKRFEGLLNAEMDIKSGADGTQIIITIPAGD